MIIGLLIGASVALVAFGGLLAAVDAALSSLSRSELVELAGGSRRTAAIVAIANDIGAHVNAVTFLRVIAETASAVLVTFALVMALESGWLALLLAVLIMTAASFVLVGSSPRSVGRVHARGLISFTARVIRAVRVLLGPIAHALVAIGDRVTPGASSSGSVSSEEQLLSMVDEAAEFEVLEERDRELIHSIFDFSDTMVREVMVPRTDMVTIEGDASIDSALRLFFNRGRSRLPVVGDDVDDVLGVLYLRDISRSLHEQPLDLGAQTVLDLARPAQFVPESKQADELLRQMQLEKNHMALVVDEYGGIAGLVTMEDLIEELVGEISDEHDRRVADVVELSDGVFRVNAALSLDDVGDIFGLDIEDEDVDSIGGLLTKELGRLPEEGASVVVSGLVLTAERTEGRRRRLRTVVVERDEALLDAQLAFGDGGASDDIAPDRVGGDRE